MVSNLYTAEKFFKLQGEGKIAKNMPFNKRLRMDSQGYFYLKNNKGKIFRQDVGKNAKVYARSAEQGVTKYSKSRDRAKKDVTRKTEGIKKHSAQRHKYDRKAKTGKVYYI